MAGAVLTMSLLAGCDLATNGPSATTSALPSPGPVPTTTTTLATSTPPSRSLTPVPKVFDETAVQDAVFKVLAESYQIKGLETVICPKDQPVKTGTKFSCTATIEGKQKMVPIQVTSDDGTYSVSMPK